MPETPFARPAPDASSGEFVPHFRRALAYAAGALRLDGGFARRELELPLAVAGGRARRAGMRSCMGPMLRSKVEGDYTISHLRWTTLKRFRPWAYICPGAFVLRSWPSLRNPCRSNTHNPHPWPLSACHMLLPGPVTPSPLGASTLFPFPRYHSGKHSEK